MRRGILPVIALALIAGCANAPPKEIVRSSTPIVAASLPPLGKPATRRFKETLLFVARASEVRDVVDAIDPREAHATYVLSGARGDAVVDLRFPASPIELALTPSTSELLFGEEGSIDVALTDDGTPIDDATIQATLVSPTDHARRTLSTTSSGTIDLRGAFRGDDPIGVWTIEVRAKGTSHGVRFDRFGTTAMHFALRSARLAEVAAPRTLDDGSIEVDATLDVATHDRLEITAFLVQNDGRPLARANTTATFDPGRATTTLRFDGASIVGSGPLAVRRVRLFSLAQNATLGILR